MLRRHLPVLLLAALGCKGAEPVEPGASDAGDPAAADSGARDASVAPPDASPGDAGVEDASRADAGRPDAGSSGLVPIFVAQGHVGRTMISCDDGMSWIANRSDDDAVRCFSGVDCDHAPGAAHGVVFGRGWFFASFGWGQPGSVRRSRDGVNWETALDGSRFGWIAFGSGRLLGAQRAPQLSDDDGATWRALRAIDLAVFNVRAAAHVDAGGERFVMAASDNGVEDLAVSDDGGDTWWKPAAIPDECGLSFHASGGIAAGNGALVVTDGSSTACRSTDGGRTFTAVTIGRDFASQLVFDGAEFKAWGSGVLLRSADGATWTSEPTAPANLQLGAVAVSPNGTYVAVNSGWNRWYDAQRFYRSTDGVRWTELPAASYTGSHPIRSIAYGEIEPTAECPGR